MQESKGKVNREVPIMPEDYKSGVQFFVKFNGTMATKWTKEEEEWCWDLSTQGFTVPEIAYSIGRDITPVSIKMKRLKKKHYSYNDRHREDKYATNDMYVEYMLEKYNIENVLDVFCGFEMYYNRYEFNVTNNDINKEIKCDYNLNANKLLDLMVKENMKFSIVDLDAFGATITYLEKALDIAEHGLVMTLGELGHRRWKRLDFISKHYSNIKTIEDITVENFVEEIIKIGKLKGKNLKVVYFKDWNNIGRVWFEIVK